MAAFNNSVVIIPHGTEKNDPNSTLPMSMRLLRNAFDLVRLNTILSFTLWQIYFSMIGGTTGYRFWYFVILCTVQYILTIVIHHVSVAHEETRKQFREDPGNRVLEAWMYRLDTLLTVGETVETTLLWGIFSIISEFIKLSVGTQLYNMHHIMRTVYLMAILFFTRDQLYGCTPTIPVPNRLDTNSAARAARLIFDITRFNTILSYALWQAYYVPLTAFPQRRIWVFFAVLLLLGVLSLLRVWVGGVVEQVAGSSDGVRLSWYSRMSLLYRLLDLVISTFLWITFNFINDFVTRTVNEGYGRVSTLPSAIYIVMSLLAVLCFVTDSYSSSSTVTTTSNPQASQTTLLRSVFDITKFNTILSFAIWKAYFDVPGGTATAFWLGVLLVTLLFGITFIGYVIDTTKTALKGVLERLGMWKLKLEILLRLCDTSEATIMWAIFGILNQFVIRAVREGSMSTWSVVFFVLVVLSFLALCAGFTSDQTHTHSWNK